LVKKRDFFDLPNWREIVDSLETRALLDPNFKVFWQVSQKYEMRMNEKLDRDVEKIRVFLAASVDFVVLQNKYCLDFNNKFMTTFNRTFNKVGFSKYKLGWNRLYHSFGNKTQTLSVDGESFDTTIGPFLIDLMAELRLDSYKLDYDRKILLQMIKFFYTNIMNSLLVLEDGILVFKEMGNTSGQASTIIDNTGVSIAALAYYYFRWCRESKLNPTIEHFFCVLTAAILGDDTLVGVDPFGSFKIDFVSMCKYYSEIGLKLTLEEMENVPLQDTEFMSTRFIKHESGVWLPLMNRNKMFSSLILGDKNPDPRWTLLRIYAFRTECWADKEFISMLEEFEVYVLKRHRDQLVGSIDLGNGDYITMDMVYRSRLSDRELDFLYMGLEDNLHALYFDFSLHAKVLQLNW